MAEWSKAPDSSIIPFRESRIGCSGLRMEAWVRIPLLTHFWSIFGPSCKVMNTLCFTEALIVVAEKYSKIKRNCSKVGRSIYTYTDIIFSSENNINAKHSLSRFFLVPSHRSVPPAFPAFPTVSPAPLSSQFACSALLF